jgi:aminoglycoside 3-N-acetyltransferase
MIQKDVIRYFNSHFNKLKIKKNDNIVIHSNLSTFGIYNKNLPYMVLKTLLKLISKNGTLILSDYNFNKTRKQYSNSENKNSLSLVFKKKLKYIKSKSLIHSHIGFGKKSDFLSKTNMLKSFGENSDFAYFYKFNFKLILLGSYPSEGASYLHHVEYMNAVKYRKKKIIKIKFIKKNKTKITYAYDYYARKKNIKINFDNIIKFKPNFIIEEKIKYGSSFSMKIRDLDRYANKKIKNNNNFFLK